MTLYFRYKHSTKSVPLTLPVSAEERDRVLSPLDSPELDRIGSPVETLWGYLYDEDIRDSDIFRKFNQLAEQVDQMQPEDTLKLPGVLHLLCTDHSVDSVLQAINRIQDYTCLSRKKPSSANWWKA